MQQQPASIAVRNRKAYFIELVKEKLLKLQRPLRILNIASGPCRDLFELFEQIPIKMLEVECVEMDENAINFSRKLLGNDAELIMFHKKNIFRFDTNKEFDLIWSAGLFDYFQDKLFVKLLSRFNSWCTHSGEIVIGNFSEINPSRNFMEKACEWYLHHRSEKDLINLAFDAGYSKECIKVKSEPLGINCRS